jgi:2Fe-2S ferredoxin
MPKVTFVQHDGVSRTIDIPVGMSVMQGAFRNTINGIIGGCGGSCVCATCHVFVEPAWADRLPPMQGTESDMLECTAVEKRDNSRLSCQLHVTDALDGLVVHIPERQE